MASPTSATYENQALVLYLLYLVPSLFSSPPLLIGPLFRSELPSSINYVIFNVIDEIAVSSARRNDAFWAGNKLQLNYNM